MRAPCSPLRTAKPREEDPAGHPGERVTGEPVPTGNSVVIGDVVRLGIGGHQLCPIITIRSHHQRLGILVQPHEQLATHLERGCAVRSSFFDVAQ